MTIKQKTNPDQSAVELAGGFAAFGAAKCISKYASEKVASRGILMLRNLGRTLPGVGAGAGIGGAIGTLLYPEVIVIGGLIALGAALLEFDE